MSADLRSIDGPCEIFYGGSFDPIHIGHLMVASEVCDSLACRTLLFVPAGQNPLKTVGPLASASDRLAMVSAAIERDHRFSVSSIEIKRDGPSRTFDTVRRLVETGRLIKRPWLIVGDELIKDLPRWYRSEDLLSTVRLAVVSREGIPIDRLPADGKVVGNPRFEVSSKAIRERLREGRSIRYLVPDGVYDYIREHTLYRRLD